MAIRNVVTRGYGAGASIPFVVTRGYSISLVVAITVPGIEVTLPANRLHATAADARLHATMPDGRLHVSTGND